MGNGVSPATRIMLCIMFTGYLTYFYTLCDMASNHLLAYHKKKPAVTTNQCVPICTVDNILCMYDFMLWLHLYLMPCFYMCM